MNFSISFFRLNNSVVGTTINLVCFDFDFSLCFFKGALFKDDKNIKSLTANTPYLSHKNSNFQQKVDNKKKPPPNH